MKPEFDRLKPRHKLALAGIVWTPLLLALLLTGCATTSLPPSKPPEIPPSPALSEPLPSLTYSEQWRLKVEEWRKRVTPTSTTSER
jgi:hypothetical protein